MRIVLMLALILAVPGAWAQNAPAVSEYSTESVSRVTVHGNTTVMPTMKEYHGKDLKYRNDSITIAPDGASIPGITIMRMDRGLMWTILSDHNAYYESAMTPELKANMQISLTAATDRSKMKLIGTETVNGQATDKYELQPMPGHEDCKPYVFLSKDLGLPVKAETHCSDETETVTDYTNTQAGPQPDELFEVPAGYKKM